MYRQCHRISAGTDDADCHAFQGDKKQNLAGYLQYKDPDGWKYALSSFCCQKIGILFQKSTVEQKMRSYDPARLEKMEMWSVVTFDLPVENAEAQKKYRTFRKALISNGFIPAQKSIFERWHENSDMAKAACSKILRSVPPEGKIQIFFIPDSAYQRSVTIENGKQIENRQPPLPWVIL